MSQNHSGNLFKSKFGPEVETAPEAVMKDRLRIIEADYGRKCGWYVEVDGRKIACLSDPQFDDMFWDSYQLEPLTEDLEERACLYAAEFWQSCKAVYRNREFNEAVINAFVGGSAAELETRLRETGRLSMRGLYLIVLNQANPVG